MKTNSEHNTKMCHQATVNFQPTEATDKRQNSTEYQTDRERP